MNCSLGSKCTWFFGDRQRVFADQCSAYFDSLFGEIDKKLRKYSRVVQDLWGFTVGFDRFLRFSPKLPILLNFSSILVFEPRF